MVSLNFKGESHPSTSQDGPSPAINAVYDDIYFDSDEDENGTFSLFCIVFIEIHDLKSSVALLKS